MGACRLSSGLRFHPTPCACALPAGRSTGLSLRHPKTGSASSATESEGQPFQILLCRGNITCDLLTAVGHKPPVAVTFEILDERSQNRLLVTLFDSVILTA
mgnify:CR=1 FL=1